LKFIGLNGKTYNKNISRLVGRKKKSRSNGQAELGSLLRKIFGIITICEEMPCFGTRLRLDFYLPKIRTAIEFDGEQHSKYNPHFHGSRAKFAKQQMNDVRKHEWCEKNNIVLVRLTKNDLSEERLREIIGQAHEGYEGME